MKGDYKMLFEINNIWMMDIKRNKDGELFINFRKFGKREFMLIDIINIKEIELID